jgi:succinyl-diaminopimelate desuccinylase
MSLLARRFGGGPGFSLFIAGLALLGAVACTSGPANPTGPGGERGGAEGDADEYRIIDELIEQNLYSDLKKFVAIPTYRDPPALSEAQTVANLQRLRDVLLAEVDAFNMQQKTTRIESFEWKQPVEGEKRELWVFGFRLGKGGHKLALSSHLDTVPLGTNPMWKPLEITQAQSSYLGGAEDFYVGRGTIDDKGPAAVVLQVLKAVARRYDGDPRLDQVSLEVVYDTSEETDSSVLPFYKAKPEETPDLAVVYDAAWCIRAEKGIERPIFSISRTPTTARARQQTSMLELKSLDTPQGPANQIADTATAVITGDGAALKALSGEVASLYANFTFDDPGYRRAKLDTALEGDELKLTTHVEGAQHGSVPQENREAGTNPLVSLANFVAGLIDKGRLARNEVGRLAQFAAWTWGTKVFGEHHPSLLKRDDEVFTAGNGTTYALTRFYTNPANSPKSAATLTVDIRYAIGHHSTDWDRKTEGFLRGDTSRFATQVWPQIIGQFNASKTADDTGDITVQSRPSAVPDIRLTTGKAFSTVSSAYEAVIGKPCPALAIGGGTDAKGNLNFLAAGALFSEQLGPPINMHGFEEGAPVNDLKRGARILYKLLVNQIEQQTK